MRRTISAIIIFSFFMIFIIMVSARNINPVMPDRFDSDGNGYPDEGITVNGFYTELYASDIFGDYYWEKGDGTIETSGNHIQSTDDLDQNTLTVCRSQVAYRGNFENTPGLESGWMLASIDCRGFFDNGHYNYMIVHETDPRYTGDPEKQAKEGWEYFFITESGTGSLLQPGPESTVP